MRKRCDDKTDPYYGGRGISVCAEWDDFAVFKEWADDADYGDTLTIERIDNDLGYSPSNCTWIDKGAQSLNRRFVALAPDGQLWVHIARENGISDAAYRCRLNKNWTYEEAATWPMNKKRKDGNLKRAKYVLLNGTPTPVTLAAKAIGYSSAAIHQRARRKGISLQAALDEMI